MAIRENVHEGLRNALLRRPTVATDRVEWTLRRANRRVGRTLGRIEWVGSLDAYFHRCADLLLDGWTVDDGPLTQPRRLYGTAGRAHVRLNTLTRIERTLWNDVRAAHSTARLSPAKRLPVYLNAIDEPELATAAVHEALLAERSAALEPGPRRRGFAAEKYWRGRDEHWDWTEGAVALPFLADVIGCFADGLFAAALLRRGTSTRTILIGRPRLRLRAGGLHAADAPAVVWPDGTRSWYWDGINVPERLAAVRDRLTAEEVAGIRNQELRRVVLERLGWERFLETADAELRAQDDYGRLWTTAIRLDGQPVHLVEVVNATAEADGSYRRYFLRVPPTARTAREAVAWTFGFENVDDYVLAAAS